MGIKQKFLVLNGVMGLIMIIVSALGYYTAYHNLTESVDKELRAAIEVQGASIESWIKAKGQIAQSAASLHEAYIRQGQTGFSEQEKHLLSLAAADKDVLELANGTEEGQLLTYHSGDLSAKVDPRTRAWYQDAKRDKKIKFTEAYKDADKNIMEVSVAAPYFDAQGVFRGVICEDISLDTLKKEVASINYHGQGDGFIIEKTGKVLAESNTELDIAAVGDQPDLASNFNTMLEKGEGYFLADRNGVTQVVAYTTVPSTGWLAVVAVPESVVLSQVKTLQMMYAILTILGILITVVSCQLFARRITGSIVRLKEQAAEFAKGNLRLRALAVESDDEIGVLTATFNSMCGSIRDLVKKMAATAEQVAASSEELTASAHQSAEASNNVAVTVTNVAAGVDNQLTDVEQAKKDVQDVCRDIVAVSDKTQHITSTVNNTTTAAEKG